MIEFLLWSSIALILYTYFLYPALLYAFGGLFRFQGKKDDITPRVSLLLSAYNEEKYLEEKIRNCREIDYPRDRIEVIIGSDGSDDRTNEIGNRSQGDGVTFLPFTERRGKVNVINDLVSRSHGDILIFSDANTMYDPQSIRKLVRHFSDPSLGAVCGRLVLTAPDGTQGGEMEGVYWKYETWIKSREGDMGLVLGANGAIYAVRRELYQPLDPTVIIDDFVIAMRVLMQGYHVTFEPEAVAHEESSPRLSQEHSRKIRIGAGNYQALLMLLPMLNPLRGLPALVYWSHKVLRWFVPFFMLICFAANLLLLGTVLYNILFALQAFFYMMAAAGALAGERIGRVKLVHMTYYLVSMNLCLLAGLGRYITRTQKVAWKRSVR